MSKKKTSKPSKPKATKAAKAAPAEKVAHEQRNGVTQPGAGTACRAIWDAIDKLRAADKEVTFEVLRAAIDAKTADATIRTQRQRHKTYSA